MRQHPRLLILTAALLVAIAGHEAYRGEAYIPVPGDVPTIGFGQTSEVKMGDKTTPERALIVLLKDAEKKAEAVKRCADVPMYQHEFDAFVSLTYNIGEKAFCESTLVKKLKQGDYDGACKEILRWDKFKGQTLPGLTKRRQMEYQLCTGNSPSGH
jgi:lysozyme